MRHTLTSKRAETRAREKRLQEAFALLSEHERLAYIPASNEPTEFEIQSFIYESLRAAGYSIRGEVRTKCGSCLFDLVIFQNTKPVRIIEVKKNKRFGWKPAQSAASSARNKQIAKYARFGVPVDLVCTLHDAKTYVAKIFREGVGS